MTQQILAGCKLGASKTGLSIGYRVLNLDGTSYASFTTTNVAETSILGEYVVTVPVDAPDSGGRIVFGVSGTDYAWDLFDPAPLTAAQVNAEVDTALADVGLTTTVTGRIDATVSSRLAAAGYTTPPTVGQIDTQLSGVHGSGAWSTATGFSTLDASGVRSAVGLASANLDTQLSGINSKTTNLPASPAAVGSAMTLADGAITAAKIASDAITDAKVAADVTIASVTGSVGSVAGNVGGNVAGSVNSVTSGVTVATNNDKTGYALSSAGIQAIWDALTSALTAVGSIGKLFVDNINASINSRLAAASYTAPDNASITAIKAKTDNLPSDPADESLLEAAITAATSGLSHLTTSDIDARLAAYDASTGAEAASIMAAIAALNNLSSAGAQAAAAAALAAYDAATGSNVASLATASALGSVASDVSAILADTGTDGVVVSAATLNAIADAVLTRSATHVEGTEERYNIVEVVLGILHSTSTGTTWTIKKSNGSTFSVRTLTEDANALPVTGIT